MTAFNRATELSMDTLVERSCELKKIGYGLADLRTLVHAKDPKNRLSNKLDSIDFNRCFNDLIGIN